MIRHALSLLSALVLAACGGGAASDPGPPPDIKLDQANKAGTQALSMDLPAVAVRQYRVALSRAYLVEAIARAPGLGKGNGPVDHGWPSRDPEAFAILFAKWRSQVN